ncbi:SDR family NAD(P)-dependent oxidoreductase [Sphingomonas profundi]|uniref:SDR family NAD(P)-dependent oxidoreductase n=1 Tax=Alterirhizorhabdus profundi TaxID=2681549 RepID=UPI0012E8ABFC|nr:SDR family oxidoreductase [Sphingomonas profundi]
MGLLEGKRAVVIGAAEPGNMGQAIARRYRDEGAQVTVASRRAEKSAAFAAEIGGHSTACDLTRKADVHALADFAIEKMGGIDIAVNSTGLALGAPFLEFGEANLDTLIALQFKGSFFFLQAMVQAMLGRGGSIIQISSAVAQPSTTVDGGYDAYMGTKAGIDHVVRAVANQFGREGIRVNTIAAGHTDTPMHHDNFGGGDIPAWMKQVFAEATPLGRYGTSEDIAEAAVWLARDQCFMTGQALQVNGGLTLRRNPLKHDLERAERDWQAAQA